MGDTTGIKWTDRTFNGWEGCSKVSPGCKNCYAEARDIRFTGGSHWGPGAPRRRTVVSNWNKPRRWNKDALAAGRRDRVFCSSLSDVFDAEVDPKWRADLWDLIRATPALDWQLLTKRPENLPAMLPAGWGSGWPNVWLGTSVEDQERADLRIPLLLQVPAVVRFLSCDPLLEAVDLAHIEVAGAPEPGAYWDVAMIDWVIVGGESDQGGKMARPCAVEWIAGLVWPGGAESIPPVFVKQLGSTATLGGHLLHLKDSHGGDWDEWTGALATLKVREFPEVRR